MFGRPRHLRELPTRDVSFGVFFSTKRFPAEAQPFIQALPLTQVNDALREVMLEGATLPAVAWRLGILLAWTVVPLYLGLRWFRWR